MRKAESWQTNEKAMMENAMKTPGPSVLQEFEINTEGGGSSSDSGGSGGSSSSDSGSSGGGSSDGSGSSSGSSSSASNLSEDLKYDAGRCVAVA
jgi:hypothetical protein